MPRDLKVGFALGVLLVGVVGALFFRRDTSHSAPPALENAAEIDQQIAAKSNGPYMMGPEEFVGANESDEPAPAKLNASTGPVYEVPSFLTNADAEDQFKVLADRNGAAPNPVAQTGPAVPDHNRGWQVGPGVTSRPVSNGLSLDNPLADEDDEIKLPADAVRSPSSSSSQTYVTRAGDTLSGLAGRFLGSQGRFRELYELNRDVLRSPNELPEGVTIRIPASQTEAARSSAVATPPAKGQTSIGQEWETPAESARPKSTAPASTEEGEGPVVIREPGSTGRSFRASQHGRLGAGRIEVDRIEMNRVPQSPEDQIREPARPSGGARVIEKVLKPTAPSRTPAPGEPILGIE
jgi:hypothetical protein